MLVSIIIPTSNRADALRRTLESVAQMDFLGQQVEILTVDNGSVDQTPAVYKWVKEKYPNREWHYIYDAMPGLLTGRHRGAEQAKGDILAFLDDDVRLGSDWFGALLECFEDPKVMLAGGPSIPLFETNPPRWLNEFYSENEHARYCGWLSLLEGGNQRKEIPPRFVWGLNYVIRKTTLFNIGGFHPDCIPPTLQRYQGDGESGLSCKISQAGLKTLYNPQLSVQHEVPRSRLTAEYFKRRGYYQGVSDSYAEVRSTGYAPSRILSWKDLFRPAKQALVDIMQLMNSPSNTVKHRAAKSYKMGFDFHQTEVRNDPKLLEWVTRKDYFDYRLPEGWRQYLRDGVR